MKWLFIVFVGILLLPTAKAQDSSRASIIQDSLLYFDIEGSESIDDFTGEIKYHSPMTTTNSGTGWVMFYKFILKGVPRYYIGLEVCDMIYILPKTGVIVLFTDGTKWSKPDKVDVDVNAYNKYFPYRYSALIRLTPTDIQLFTKKTIKKYRLYLSDHTIYNEQNAEDLKKYLSYLLKMK